MTQSVYDRARDAATITGVAGVKLTRQGKQLRGECPLCGAGKKSKSAPFSAEPVKKVFKCWSCGEAGDVIDLYRMMFGYDRLEAAQRLAGEATGPRPVMRPDPVRVHVPEGPSFSEVMARDVWRETVHGRHTPVQRYLLGRSIHGQVLLSALEVLRFHPHVYQSGPPSRPICFPAQVGQTVSPGDDGRPIPTGGIHVTYLAPGGKGRAKWPDGTTVKKKMFGPQTFDGRPGGIWLAPLWGDGPLVMGEGIETAASLAVLNDGPCRPLATLALDRLQGGWRADAMGCRDPGVPQIDIARPPLTWPEPPGAPWGEVQIGVDHDMAPVNVKVRGTARFDVVDHTLDATDRARICASLASSWWARAAPAARIVPLIAPKGQDWNDYLMETLRE